MKSPRPVHETFLFQEIHQQPLALQTFLDNEQYHIDQLVKAIKEHDISHVAIAARGTSDNAGRYAKYLLGALNQLTVALATPSLFSIYEQPPNLSKALVIGISQSGKSPDIVSVLSEARRQGGLTAAITNFADSDLAQQADHIIELHAGVEQSIAATKTYTSELMAIALLGATLSGDRERKEILAQVPDAAAAVLEQNKSIHQSGAHSKENGIPLQDQSQPVGYIAQRYRYMRDCVVIGRGYNYATAFELALKLKELTYTIAEPYSSADFLHGPLALVEHGFPVIVIAPSGLMLPQIHSFLNILQQHEAEVIVISDQPDTLAMADIPLLLPKQLPEWLSPITAIIPGQLFALHLAHARGYDPDRPRSLHKVTETR